MTIPLETQRDHVAGAEPRAPSPSLLGVCFVCSDYPPGPHGGIGTMTQTLARAMVAAGHRVRVIGVYPASYAAADREEDHGVQVERLREPGIAMGWLAARVRCYRRVAQLARRREIDLVEVPDWSGWAAGWPALPVPVIVRLNGSATYFGEEGGVPVRMLTRRLERMSIGRADFVCSSSRYTARRCETIFGLARGVDAVLHNPVEVGDTELPWDRSAPMAVFTGTLVEKKGVIPLARAWRDVAQRIPTARLHVYGKDGRLGSGSSVRAHLESVLGRYRESVVFHGHVDRSRVADALRSARLAIFPSYAEAFAVAPLESMACGCPTISSRRGSGPELITEGFDGLLVDPDRPDEIATAMLRLLEDEALARRLGSTGRRTVLQRFSVDALVGPNVRFYRRCIEGSRGPRANG